MINKNKALITNHSIGFFCFIILTVGFVLSSSAADIVGSIREERCTIQSIEGPLVKTSCRMFTLGEEVKISDATGRLIQISEIPLPSDALIIYQCISKENCASIKTIKLDIKMKVTPK